VLSIAAQLPAGSFLPRVESPWPQSIDMSLPFVLSGAFVVLSGVVNARAPKEGRDRAMTRAGIGGFVLGAAFYLIALLVQVASPL
jgi:hypothetical protein